MFPGPTTAHANHNQGDLHHPGQAPELSSSQALQYFGDTLDSQTLYSAGSNIPQFFNMIQELPVHQGVYPDVPLYEVCNGRLEDDGEVHSATEPVSSSRFRSEREALNNIEADRIASANETTEAAMLQAKRCNWYPAEHVRYQSTMDFKEDILRNRHIPINEQTFADWAWPPTERNAQKTYQSDNVRWGTDARFDSLGNMTPKMGENRIGLRQMTQFRLEAMQEDEDSGNASPSPSLSSVSQAESSRTRARTRQATRDDTTHKKSYSRPLAGSNSERQVAASEVKRQREKLTIEQKRRNHIRHEKKRRALIKDGFNDLTELIPELRGRTLSRSTILFKAADWLENLIQENEALVAQVSALESEKAANLGSGAETASQQSSQKRVRRRP